MITIHKTTKEMYDSFMEMMTDIMWDDPNSHLYEDIGRVIHPLATGNMQDIRKLFTEGYTPCLLGNHMAHVDNKHNTKVDIEVRVYHNDKLIGVVIDSEINY